MDGTLYLACLGDMVCRHLYDQEEEFNSGRFDTVGRTLFPHWPPSMETLRAMVLDDVDLQRLVLRAGAASTPCGYNRDSIDGQCVISELRELRPSLFVTLVFVAFAVMATLYAWKLHATAATKPTPA
jgi:hypothetical protein